VILFLGQSYSLDALAKLLMSRVGVQIWLMWRGAIAGLLGGIIGAIFSLAYGPNGYRLIGYVFWLIVTVILGMTFTLIIGAIQRMKLTLPLVIRAVIGGTIGLAMAWTWVSIVRRNLGSPINSFSKGIVMMIISTGILSGILAAPIKKGT